MGLAKVELVNARSVQAFKPVKDFCRIEGNNAVLSVVFAGHTQCFERVLIRCTDKVSPGITVVGNKPLNLLGFLWGILMQTLLRLEIISPQTLSIATPQPVGFEGDAAAATAGAKSHDLIGFV